MTPSLGLFSGGGDSPSEGVRTWGGGVSGGVWGVGDEEGEVPGEGEEGRGGECGEGEGVW